MALFGRKSKRSTGLPHEGPGHYETEPSDQIAFDLRTRHKVEANHWKLATFVLIFVTAVAVMTRNPPPVQVHAYGIEHDAQGNPTVVRLTDFKPDDLEVKVALKDLVIRMWTIEPVFTQDIQQSRLVKNLRSVQNQMTGTGSSQFATWLASDRPIQTVTDHPEHARTVDILSVQALDDQTVVVEFTTTETDSVGKPVVSKYIQTFRWQQIQPSSDSVVTTNEYGVYVAFFTYQRESKSS